MSREAHPYAVADLEEYVLGELSVEDAEKLEEHLFECARCASDLDAIHRIGVAIRDAVCHAVVGANVTSSFLARAAADGLSLREYRLEPGQTVHCSAGPEDFFVVRLVDDFSQVSTLRLEVEFEDLEQETTQTLPPREVTPDRDSGEIVLVYPGQSVRDFPRSLWSLAAEAEAADGRRIRCGPFVLDHTP